MPKLIVKEAGKTRTVLLKTSPVTIGRASSNTLYLRDTSLSRTHCELHIEGETCSVVDLGSRNGTVLNGVQIKEDQVLEIGDKIEIGNCMLIFERELPDRDYTLKPKEKDDQKAQEAPDVPSDDATIVTDRPTERKGGERKGKKSERALAAAAVIAAPDMSAWTHSTPVALYAVVAVLVLGAAAGGFFAFAGKKDPGTGDTGAKNLLGAAGAFDTAEGSWKLREGAKGAVNRLDQGGKAGGCLELELPSGTPVVEAVGPEFEVDAGKCYRVSFEARSDAPDAVAGARLEWLAGDASHDEADRSLVASPAGSWSRAERVLRAPPGCDRARIALVAAGDAGKVAFDDLAVEATKTGPESARTESAGPVSLTWGADGRFTLAAGEAVLAAGAGVGWVGGDLGVDQTLARDVRAGTGDRGTAWKLVHPVTARWEPFSAELRLEEGIGQVVLHFPARTSRGLDAVTVDFLIPGDPAEFVVHTGGGEKKRAGDFEDVGVEALQVLRGKDSFAFLYGRPVAVRVAKAAGGVRVEQGFPGKKVDELQNFTLAVAWGEAVAKAVQRGPSVSAAEALEKRGEFGRALKAYRAVAEAGKGGPEAQAAADKGRNLEARFAAELDEAKRKMDEAADLDSDELCRAVERILSRVAAEWDESELVAQTAQLQTDSAALRKAVGERRQAAEAGRLLAQARGFAADSQPTLARTMYRTVSERFPSTEWAKEAQTAMQDLKE